MDHLPSRPTLRILAAALSCGLLWAGSGCEAGGDAGSSWSASAVDVSFLDPGGMPHLSPTEDGAVLSWWAPLDEGHELRAVEWRSDSGFGQVRAVTRGTGFFVNWADFPSVVPVAPGKWVAHWLQRNGDGTYAYGVRLAVSEDAGATWSEAWTPHEDGTATEHGFVTVWPHGDGGWSAVWLDGRKYAEGPHGAPTNEMTVRSRTVSADGTPGPVAVVDGRACDCCQTDVAWTERGPVAVYRDRTGDEVRDIYVTRRGPEGWTVGRPVHEDGWVIGGCPVNGPAVDASGSHVVVAWFTGAQDRPRVRVAFSDDAGDTFGAPIEVDLGRPVGRVDVVRGADGAARVLWLEEAEDGAARLLIRRVTARGDLGEPWALAEASAARASGFPHMVSVGQGRYLASWTEVREEGPSRLRVAVVEER